MEVAPKHILIVGSGVFGLSTAYALTQRPLFSKTRITVLDRSVCPCPDGSSVDTSRIIRPDYHDSAYAKLAALAQDEWRKQGPDELGGEGRYTEAGLLLVANKGQQGEEYVKHAFENVKGVMALAGDKDGLEYFSDRASIEKTAGTGGGSGDWGYLNKRSGWADAEASMVFLRRKVEATKRVDFHVECVESLIYGEDGSKVTGVKLSSGSTFSADLTILATGAWTPKLVDLRGRAHSTGQVLCYLEITDAEQEALEKMPTLLNMSTGMFIIPPRNKLLKVARHGYGYSNPISVPNPNPSQTEKEITVSLPLTCYDSPTLTVPLEGTQACRAALTEMIPSLSSRPFTHSKICWYTDTPTADFIITHHPSHPGLFLATGGSGHGFKFLPVIGEKIVDSIEGRTPAEFREKWEWKTEGVRVDGKVVTEDGSRGGKGGMILAEELARRE